MEQNNVLCMSTGIFNTVNIIQDREEASIGFGYDN